MLEQWLEEDPSDKDRSEDYLRLAKDNIRRTHHCVACMKGDLNHNSIRKMEAARHYMHRILLRKAGNAS
jgi:hypothetical protein